jgi:hypothetical protein
LLRFVLHMQQKTSPRGVPSASHLLGDACKFAKQVTGEQAPADLRTPGCCVARHHILPLLAYISVTAGVCRSHCFAFCYICSRKYRQAVCPVLLTCSATPADLLHIEQENEHLQHFVDQDAMFLHGMCCHPKYAPITAGID